MIVQHFDGSQCCGGGLNAPVEKGKSCLFFDRA